MRLMQKTLGAVAALALSVSLLAGCGSTAGSAAASSSAAGSTAVSAVSEAASSEAADENEAAAAQLMKDLTGSYQELWPVILADEHTQTWLDDCTALVGEDNAEGAYEKLSSMVTGDVYGDAYFCGFTQGLATLTFDGENSVISGTDKDGSTLFSHSYHYIAWSRCAACMNSRATMPIPGSSPTSSWHPTPAPRPTTSSSAMARTPTLWGSTMPAIMLTGWLPASPPTATRP